MKRQWAYVVVGITIIVMGSLGVFYVGYAIDKNNKEQLTLIEHQRVSSNQRFCKILKLILDTGRPGPFKDAVIEIYNSSDYQCQKVENQ